MTTSTSTDLSRLSITDTQVEWSAAQRDALESALKVHHATDADMRVFFHQARRTGLDPFLRQLYMIARQEYNKETNRREWRQTFQTGIDGFRVIAHRRARQLGQVLTYDDTIYFDDQGKKHDVWIKDAPPSAVRVTVHMGESRFPFTAKYSDYVVEKDEYSPDRVEDGKTVKGTKTGNRVPSGMWATRPAGQLEKCAEAGALRRACPQDLSGIYEFSEMEQQGPVVDETGRTEARGNSTEPSGRDWLNELELATSPEEVNAIWQACKDAGERNDEFDNALGVAVQRIRAAQEVEWTEHEAAQQAEVDEAKKDAEWGVLRSYDDNAVLRPATREEWEYFSGLPEDEAAVIEINGGPFYIERDEPSPEAPETTSEAPEPAPEESDTEQPTEPLNGDTDE